MGRVLFLTVYFNLFSILFPIHFCQAQQSLKHKHSSYYTYIYKISSEQARKFSRRGMIDYSRYCTTVIDSFPTDSSYKNVLVPGHYLFMSIDRNWHKYTLKTYSDIVIKLLEQDQSVQKQEHFLLVTNKAGDILKNAEVKINKRNIPFNSETQTFNFTCNKAEALLTVKTDNELVFYDYSKDAFDFIDCAYTFLKKPVVFTRIVYWKTTQLFKDRSYGYIAFNKPKYLPGDTVKMKAFIVCKNGKPYTQPLKLSFYQLYDQKNKKELALLNPVSKGSYVYEFILPDSLKANSMYALALSKIKNKKDDISLERSFTMEDYQLNETKYKIYTTTKEFTQGEPISFFLKGTDANGLPLLDASVELTARPFSVKTPKTQPVFVPDLLWKHEQKLDNAGETKIIFPDSLLPPISMSISVRALFRNSNNETHDTTLNITLNHTSREISVKLEEGYILADYMENNSSVQKTGTVSYQYDKNRNIKKVVTFPFKEKINTFASGYIFQVNNIIKLFGFGEDDAAVELRAYRMKDTVAFELTNPRKLDIHYIISREKKEVENAASAVLNWRKIDKSTASYKAIYTYVWNGKIQTRYADVHVLEKNLTVNIQQPSEIYPGQKTDVRIKVTDYKDRPVAGVNLTASAVNNQFDQMNLPQIPYLGKGKYQSRYRYLSYANRRRYHNRNPELDLIDYSRAYPISSVMKKKFKLNTIPYYQLAFPDSGACYYSDSILSPHAQFSPFIVSKGEFLAPVLVYEDDQLIYCSASEQKRRYVFISEPGYHTIRVRTKNKEYRIEHVLLKRGWKLDFSIDADHLPKNVTVSKMPVAYTQTENKLLNSSMLYLRSTYSNYKSQFGFWQHDNVWLADSYYSSYIIAGPLKQDTIHLAMRNQFETSFVFEPGYLYTITGTTQKKEKKQDQVFRFNRNTYFTDFNISDVALTKADVLFKSPAKVQARFAKTASVSKPGHGSYSLRYNGDSSIFAIKLFKQENTASMQVYSGTQRTFYDLVPGTYAMLLITENNYCYRKELIQIKADGTLYEKLDTLIFNPCNKEDVSLTLETVNVVSPAKRSGIDLVTSNASLTGIIKDGQTDEILPGTSILLYEGEVVVQSVATDINGVYTISSVPPGNYTIRVSTLGYITLEDTVILIKGKILTKNLELQADSRSLKETVVTAMGVSRISQNLSGKVAGVRLRKSLGASTNFRFADGYASNTRMKNNPVDSETYKNAKQLRDRFFDYAYWQPNLITDKNGEATFKASFPDNITQWNSYVFAMDGKKYSGIGSTTTRSYKKIMATLSVPRFLITGDETYVIGKSLNYTNDSLKIKTLFKIDKRPVQERPVLLKDAIIDRIKLTAELQDTINVVYTLEIPGGYADGEKEKIPVFPAGVEETAGNFFALKTDTAFTLPLQSNTGTYEVYAQDNALQLLLHELDKLDKYAYYCNEQTASKLNGLLMEKKIKTELHQSFDKETKIRKLIQKLDNTQLNDGSWGWWDKSPSNYWMTAHVAKMLGKAKDMGYKVNSIDKALEFLQHELDILQGSTLLFVLDALSEMKQAAPYAENLGRIKQNQLTLYQKLSIIKIQQYAGLAYDSTLIRKNIKTDVFGNAYIGNESTDWYENSIQLSLLAYKILSNDPKMWGHKEDIRNYFLQQKRNGGWRNTLETAAILEAILPDMLKETNNVIQPAGLTLTGNQFNLSVKTFPFQTTLPKSVTSLHVSKTGASSLYFTTYTKYWNIHPEKVNGNFEVNTSFMDGDQLVKTLKAGTPITLVVNVTVKKSAEYILIEVPIPAGCSYESTPQGFGSESHREYLKHKTVIFCENLSTGHHQFLIRLQPRFTGTYTLNPAKVELMYFPTFYGREGLKKTSITD